jgi:prepilin-type N-terminal cleavage/methylation domain-containing protein
MNEPATAMHPMNAHVPNLRRAPSAPRRGARRGGFTLVEVLAASFLVAITLPVIMKGMSLASAGADLARRKTEASSLAESKLDELVATNLWQSGSLSGQLAVGNYVYQWTGELNPWGTGQGVGAANVVQELDVHVTWDAPDGPRSVTVSTLVYQSANASPTTGSTGTTTGGL